MSTFTVQVDAGNGQGIWQPVAPPELADGETAEQVAREAADAFRANREPDEDGPWRIRVWPGVDADPGAPPAAEVES